MPIPLTRLAQLHEILAKVHVGVIPLPVLLCDYCGSPLHLTKGPAIHFIPASGTHSICIEVACPKPALFARHSKAKYYYCEKSSTWGDYLSDSYKLKEV